MVDMSSHNNYQSPNGKVRENSIFSDNTVTTTTTTSSPVHGDNFLSSLLDQAKSNGLVPADYEHKPQVNTVTTTNIVQNVNQDTSHVNDQSKYLVGGHNVNAGNVGANSVIWLNNILLI